MKLNGKYIRINSMTKFLSKEIKDMRLDDLPEDVRDWYEKFLVEYYAGEFSENPVHPESMKKEVRKNTYRHWVDIMNASPQQITKSLSCNRRGKRKRYGLNDWLPANAFSDIENLFAEALTPLSTRPPGRKKKRKKR